MVTNLERYQSDLDSLIADGETLLLSMGKYCDSEEFLRHLTERLGDEADARELMDGLPVFPEAYQSWYSEAKAVIKQLLPDRLQDFVRHYERPKSRKEITFGSYRIEDCLQGLAITRSWGEKVVGLDAAAPHVRQQLAILKSAKKRFESSLFDIRQLVQAHLLDSELEAAGELAKKGFLRGAGAVAGVVLERHLGQMCSDHGIKLRKKKPGIADYNDALKKKEVIDVPSWRFVQHLGDLRNLCDHDRDDEPSPDQVGDLIAGVSKATKTLF